MATRSSRYLNSPFWRDGLHLTPTAERLRGVLVRWMKPAERLRGFLVRRMKPAKRIKGFLAGRLAERIRGFLGRLLSQLAERIKRSAERRKKEREEYGMTPLYLYGLLLPRPRR